MYQAYISPSSQEINKFEIFSIHPAGWSINFLFENIDFNFAFEAPTSADSVNCTLFRS